MTPFIKKLPFNEFIEVVESNCNLERQFAVPSNLISISKRVYTFDEAVKLMEVEAITYYEKHSEPLMMELYDHEEMSPYSIDYVCEERSSAHDQFAKERWGD